VLPGGSKERCGAKGPPARPAPFEFYKCRRDAQLLRADSCLARRPSAERSMSFKRGAQRKRGRVMGHNAGRSCLGSDHRSTGCTRHHVPDTTTNPRAQPLLTSGGGTSIQRVRRGSSPLHVSEVSNDPPTPGTKSTGLTTPKKPQSAHCTVNQNQCKWYAPRHWDAELGFTTVGG